MVRIPQGMESNTADFQGRLAPSSMNKVPKSPRGKSSDPRLAEKSKITKSRSNPGSISNPSPSACLRTPRANRGTKRSSHNSLQGRLSIPVEPSSPKVNTEPHSDQKSPAYKLRQTTTVISNPESPLYSWPRRNTSKFNLNNVSRTYSLPVNTRSVGTAKRRTCSHASPLSIGSTKTLPNTCSTPIKNFNSVTESIPLRRDQYSTDNRLVVDDQEQKDRVKCPTRVVMGKSPIDEIKEISGRRNTSVPTPMERESPVRTYFPVRSSTYATCDLSRRAPVTARKLGREAKRGDVDNSALANRLRKIRRFIDPLAYDAKLDARPVPRLEDFHEARTTYQKHWDTPEVGPHRFPDVDKGYDEKDLRLKSYYRPNPFPTNDWERSKVQEYHLQRSARQSALERKKRREAAQRDARRRSYHALYHQQPTRRSGIFGPLSEWTSLTNDARRSAEAKKEAAQFGVTALDQVIETLKDTTTGNSMYKRLANGSLVDVPTLLEWQWAFSNEVLRPDETFESYFGYKYEDAVPTDWPFVEGRMLYDSY